MMWHVHFCKFSEPLHLQGASSNFLVLRIKTHKTRVSQANSGKEGLKMGLLSYYKVYQFLRVRRKNLLMTKHILHLKLSFIDNSTLFCKDFV